MGHKRKNPPSSGGKPVPARGRPGIRELPRAKETAFRVAALLVPFVLLAIIEVVCHAFGFGGYPPVFMRVGEDAGVQWLTTHRPGTDAFFPVRGSLTGGMRVVQFTTPKPPNTVRVVLLGGSAIQGFPQPLPLTNGAFLEVLLPDTLVPARNVEVLNFGATAVASFPVMHFLDDVLQYDPDLVIVMAGNNEFYGAYGVASLHQAFRSPTGMRIAYWVRSLGVTQWFASLRSQHSVASGPLMEQAAKNARIRSTDSARRAAAKSLQSHLTTIVRRCRARDVPVVVCTLPTNERALAPIGSDAETSLSMDQRAAFDASLVNAKGALRSDPEQSEQHARQALRLNAASAHAHFALANALTQLERHEEAHREYIAARDLDTMPWRASSSARDAVLAAAATGAILCDMEAAFRQASPGGSIGWELMDDHVHMSLAGQVLFAQTVVHVLSAFAGPLHVDDQRLVDLSVEALAANLGRSIYTDYVAANRVRSLFRIPFMQQNNDAALQRIEQRCKDLLLRMSAADRRALERWRDPSLHGLTDRPLSFVVGIERLAEEDFVTAEQLFRTSRGSVPRVSLWRLELTWLVLKCHRLLRLEPTLEDQQFLREAIAIGQLLRRFGHQDTPQVLRYLGLAYNLAGEHASAVECLERAAAHVVGRADWEVVAALSDSYIQRGRVSDARLLLQRTMKIPDLADPARVMLRALATQLDTEPQ